MAQQKMKWTCPGCGGRFLTVKGLEPDLCPECEKNHVIPRAKFPALRESVGADGRSGTTWACSDCQQRNPAREQNCRHCGAPRRSREQSASEDRNSDRYPALQALSGVYKFVGILSVVAALIAFLSAGDQESPRVFVLFGFLALINALFLWGAGSTIDVFLAIERHTRKQQQTGERMLAALERMAGRIGN